MIKIYFTPKCGKCSIAKQILDKHFIKYTTIDLTEKERTEDRKFFRSLGLQYLPLIIIEKENEKKLITDCSESNLTLLIESGELRND